MLVSDLDRIISVIKGTILALGTLEGFGRVFVGFWYFSVMISKRHRFASANCSAIHAALVFLSGKCGTCTPKKNKEKFKTNSK